MRILISGANGFVGSALAAHLCESGYEVHGLVRRETKGAPHLASLHIAGGLTDRKPVRAALSGVDVVVHTAARAHVMHDSSGDPAQHFRKVNVEGTLCLAQEAARAGVQRFVFLSSIKVNGESTRPGTSFTEQDQPDPRDAYGVSKHEAEVALKKIASSTGMEAVIVRPPLVYGPGVKANFLRMMQWVDRGIPLPLGGVNNARSLVALPNLVDFVKVCLQHPSAANETFLVSDREDLSTSDLLTRVGIALGKPARLFAVPEGVMRLGARVVGKEMVVRRLLDCLTVDISKAVNRLGWRPTHAVDAVLHDTATAFRRGNLS